MNLIREPYLFSPEGIKKIEELKSARWLLDTEHKNTPVSIFWQDERHPQGSNFFALHYYHDGLLISNGAFILDQVIEGVLLPNGDVIYSRHVHDYCQYGDVAIDGGREYTRVVGNLMHPIVEIRVTEKGEIRIEQV